MPSLIRLQIALPVLELQCYMILIRIYIQILHNLLFRRSLIFRELQLVKVVLYCLPADSIIVGACLRPRFLLTVSTVTVSLHSYVPADQY